MREKIQKELDFLKLLFKEGEELSHIARAVAGLTTVTRMEQLLDGKPLASQEDIDWATNKAVELGLIPNEREEWEATWPGAN